MDTRRTRKGPTLRAVLFAGFGLTLVVWVAVGYQFTRRVSRMQTAAAEINERYSRAQGRLAAVRREVLAGAVSARDALLDPDLSHLEAYRRRVETAYETADRSLREYVPVLDASMTESAQVRLLRRLIAEYRDTLLAVLSGDSSQWRSEARALLSDRVVPKRDGAIRVTEELQALNRQSFIEQQTASTALFATTQRQMWQLLGLAMLAGLAIATLATFYASTLERRLRVERDRQTKNASDLQRLSARIIRVQEEERRTIARELHDEVGQVLTAIKVEVASAQRAIETAGGNPQLLQNTRTITDGALQTVRDLSRLLHPAVLDDLGLPAALDWHLREFGRRHGLAVRIVAVAMEDRLPPAIEIAVYRIVQEALNNVARHAKATSCVVELRRWPEVLVVSVEDDGVGFDSGKAAHRGLGLIGIRERVAELDGKLRIDSAPGRGTRLVIDIFTPPLEGDHTQTEPELPLVRPRMKEQYG
jgi:signal transduction histidine kinase